MTSTDMLIDLVITPETTPVTETVNFPKVFWVDDQVTFTPKRGFETVLFGALRSGIRNESELVDHLLSSGDYHRVAPKAAELRPTKPTRFLLKTWTAAGIVRSNA